MSEAFNQIAEALALNGFSYVKKSDQITVRNVSSVQRDGIEVLTELKEVKPQRMATLIIKLKHISAVILVGRLGRLLNSSYGEIATSLNMNQIIITDFTYTLERMQKMVIEMDIPVDAKTQKMIDRDIKDEFESKKRNEFSQKKINKEIIIKDKDVKIEKKTTEEVE